MDETQLCWALVAMLAISALVTLSLGWLQESTFRAALDKASRPKPDVQPVLPPEAPSSTRKEMALRRAMERIVEEYPGCRSTIHVIENYAMQIERGMAQHP